MRPASAAGGRGRRPAAGGGRPSRALRLVVLGGVLAVLAVLLAPALRAYLAQQQEIASLRAHVQQQKAQVADLEREKAAWDDPAYVKAQARDRLKFVMPGEKAYTVIDPAPQEAKEPASPVRAAAQTAQRDRSWFDDVWRSAQIAGGTAAPGEAGVTDDPGVTGGPGAPATGDAARVTDADLDAVERQLGRRPRGVASVAHRCPCGDPDVLETEPRLPDGTPFPTTYYLTCPRLTGAISTLESSGLMAEMTGRLGSDADLAAGYRAAHEDYLARRGRLGDVPEIAGISAGGMPTRVKCLHVLAGHALAAGRGVNPLGDEVLDALLAGDGPWWAAGPCTRAADGAEPAEGPA